MQTPSVITPAAPARFVSAQVRPSPKHSLVLYAVLCALGAVVAVGGYFGYKQMMQLRQDASRRADMVRDQVSGQVTELQQRFDEFLGQWQSQGEKEALKSKLVSHESKDIGVSFQYPATLGKAAYSSGEASITFSANPDIKIMKAETEEACEDPLVVSEEGYCDAYDLSGYEAVERVAYDGQTVLLQLRVGNVLMVADLGTPPLEGRDVFAPADVSAQEAELEQYFRSVLKKQGLPPVVQETLDQFWVIARTITVMPQSLQ